MHVPPRSSLRHRRRRAQPCRIGPSTNLNALPSENANYPQHTEKTRHTPDPDRDRPKLGLPPTTVTNNPHRTRTDTPLLSRAAHRSTPASNTPHHLPSIRHTHNTGTHRDSHTNKHTKTYHTNTTDSNAPGRTHTLPQTDNRPLPKNTQAPKIRHI